MRNLKTLLYSLVLFSTTIFAQTPQGINYQATVRNSSGDLIVNQNIYFKFNVIQGSQTGTPLYTETHYVPTDDLGQVNLVIGQGTATLGTFNIIDWSLGNYFLGIEVDTGSGYIAMGTTQLFSVPYALYAENALYAETSGNAAANLPSGTNTGDVLTWDGTNWVAMASTPASEYYPTVETVVVSNILALSTTSGGSITDDGGYSITSKGVCWSTNPDPTIDNSTTNDGTGAAAFTSSLTGLSHSTTYYYRAYATNSIGTGYGLSFTFTTATTTTINTVTPSNISGLSAQSGGYNISDGVGGSSITAKGVCWSTSQNPTTADALTTDGTGDADFTSTMTGLTANTTYYVRAYATNDLGTTYGNEVSFTTANLAIGDSYQGGIVFYLDGLGGGLIAAPSDQSTGAAWGCQGTSITGADGTAIGTGNQNTIDIEAGCTETGTAADICANLTLGGYSDWFLPSKDELNQMYLNQAVIGMGTSWYWSSTEASGNYAWEQYFYNGNQIHYNKYDASFVRAVRAF